MCRGAAHSNTLSHTVTLQTVLMGKQHKLQGSFADSILSYAHLAIPRTHTLTPSYTTAKVLEGTLEMAKTVIETPYYMSRQPHNTAHTLSLSHTTGRFWDSQSVGGDAGDG